MCGKTGSNNTGETVAEELGTGDRMERFCGGGLPWD